MMNKTKIIDCAVAKCEKLLQRERSYNIEHSILSSEVRIIDRLLRHTVEMADVYRELDEKLNESGLWSFLRLLLSTTAFWHPEANRATREVKRQLVEVNSQISKKAYELSDLLRKRDDFHNSSSFCSGTHYAICDLVKNAAKDNYYFTNYVQDRFSLVSNDFDLKYWPSIAEVIDELALNAKNATVQPCDSLTEAVTVSQRNSLTDYFKVLFASIEKNSSSYSGDIPADFSLSDNSLATLANCALEIDPESIIDAQYIKRLRQRIRESGQVNYENV